MNTSTQFDDHIPTFNDLRFTTHPALGSHQARHQFHTGYEISVVAGPDLYSSPRKMLDDPYAYDSYEVAVIDQEGNFVSANFVPDEHGAEPSILTYATRDEISDLMTRVFLKDKLDRMI